MNLVGYSDSEGSDSEAAPATKPAARTITKPTPKLVDPGTNKVKVNLSSLTAGAGENGDADNNTRPAKRQRTEGGLNINAFLPPPKQPAKPLNNESTYTLKKTAGKGLGRGVNLKTGAEPAFTRSEASSSNLDLDGEPKDIKDVIAELRRGRAPADHASSTISTNELPQPTGQEVKLVGNPMRFKPKSVARGPVKKKAHISAVAAGASIKNAAQSTSISPTVAPISSSSPQTARPTKPKVSLFSIQKEATAPAAPDPDPTLEDDTEMAEATDEAWTSNEPVPADHSFESSATTAQTAAVVDDLNLSASDMRQLFGRKAGKKGAMPDLSGVKMVNYSADAQYAQNEELRAKGEIVQHNQVRAIAPGKHSLKQLVNAAATQADALEEHFAQGKRNQKEAGSRYGW